MLNIHLLPRFKVLLPQLLFALSVFSAAQAQIGMAPLKRLGTKVTCHVGAERYQLTPDKKLIVEKQFAPDSAQTQKVFNEVEPYTNLTIRVYTLPVTDDINVQICPSDYGMNFIAYSPEWLQKIYDETSSRWALYAVIAHEIAHYARGHDRTAIESEPEIELEADKYAGEVLARMGASLRQAQAAYDSQLMRTLHDNIQPGIEQTHPAIKQRLAAVKEGWLKGRDLTAASRDNTSNDSASGIPKGPVKSNHAVYRGGNEFRFKVAAVQFNTHDSVRKAADDLTDELGSHVANDQMYYWTRGEKEERFLLAWANVAAGKFGWVVVENVRGNWYYKSNGDTEWTLIRRGAERIKVCWNCSGQKVEIFLKVPRLCGDWTTEDIQYGFGNPN